MKKILLSTVLLYFLSPVFINAQVSINNDGDPPPASAMFEVKSSDKGILISRMSAAQRDGIGSPAQGLMVYVTDDNSFYYYSGSAWLKIQPGADWTVAGTDMYSAGTGNVGIGITNPAAKLDVQTSLFSAQMGNANHAVFGQYLSNINYGFLGGPFTGDDGHQFPQDRRLRGTMDISVYPRLAEQQPYLQGRGQ